MDIEAANALIIRNIRSLIEETGTNPSRLAKEAGLGHTSIRDILSSTSSSPRYGTLIKIANALGVDVRRITIGPGFEKADPHDVELLDLLHQLEPSERRFLINAAKAQIADRRVSPPKPDEEPE